MPNIPIMRYDVTNWYWADVTQPGQVYASARAAYVPTSDATYTAWLAAGGVPTHASGPAALQALFAEQYPPAWPTPATAYAAWIEAGLTITSTATPTLDGVYAIDPEAQSSIAVEAQFISTFGEFTNGGTVALPWLQANGAVVSFPSITAFVAYAKGSGQAVAAAKVAAMQGSMVMPSPAIALP